MKNFSLSTSSDFSTEIESLRGLAALFVLFGHLYLVAQAAVFFPAATPKALKIFIASVFNPQPAVLLFFAISGLVLGRQLRKNPVDSIPSYFAYLLRRGFRLMPLIWVSVVFAFLLFPFYEVSFSILYKNLKLKDISLNIVLWSIRVELWCSLFFPLLFWLFRIQGIKLNILLFLGFTLMSYFVNNPIFMQFWVFFHAGLLIDALSANVKINFLKNPLILVIAYLIFILAPEFSIGLRNWNYGCWQSWVLPEIVACSYILFFVIHNKNSAFNSFLRHSWIRYFGKISFSIYLLHFPLLKFMIWKFPITSLANLISFATIFFVITIALSALAYRFIELPFNQLGRKLANYLVKDLFSKSLPETNSKLQEI
ncbi:MAG: acyltransferase [Tatlockia sp.]|nr:acyltransferase [Tatlockia sp.]